LKPGQTVLAFGSPFGYFQFSVTRGIISALDRPNPYRDDPRKPGGFIQTDAAINPGNSGGPLVDAHGELIGINTFIISDSGSFAGAGFAIPSQTAHSTVDSIIKTGSVHHGYLGIGIEDVTPENAKFFNLQDASGAIVTQVTPDSPGSRAGLKTGDVVRELDGKTVPNSSALQLSVSEHAPGTTMSVDILRDGKAQSLSVKLGEYHATTETADASTGAPQQQGKLGLAVDDLSPEIRQQLSVPTQVHGVAVEEVRPSSPAEDAGLAQGDIIVEVNRHPVQSAQNFASEVHSAPAGKDLLLLVWAKGGASYRVVHPEQANQNGM
jgi:serine protease Do